MFYITRGPQRHFTVALGIWQCFSASHKYVHTIIQDQSFRIFIRNSHLKSSPKEYRYRNFGVQTHILLGISNHLHNCLFVYWAPMACSQRNRYVKWRVKHQLEASYIFVPSNPLGPNLLTRINHGMNKQLNILLGCNYISTLGFKLIHISTRGAPSVRENNVLRVIQLNDLLSPSTRYY